MILMATLQFDESQFTLRSRKILGEPEVPVLIKFLVTKGLVKNENQAIGLLLTIISILIVISVFVTTSKGTKPATLDTDYIHASIAPSLS